MDCCFGLGVTELILGSASLESEVIFGRTMVVVVELEDAEEVVRVRIESPIFLG